MNLIDIRRINEDLYKLDDKITRTNKVIFMAALVFCIKGNRDFQNPNKLTSLINFVDEKHKPIDQIISLARIEINKLSLNTNTKKAVNDSLNMISGVSTTLDHDRESFKKFIIDFISKHFVSIRPEDPFFEALYSEIDKKAGSSDLGIVLTPVFAAQLMVDLCDLDYKSDVVADLCSGTGLFSLLSFTKMYNNLNQDFKQEKISKNEYDQYLKRLANSVIANDNDSKMVTITLANFLLKGLNTNLLYSENVLSLQKSSFKINIDQIEQRVKPTKAILNPPYEDKFKPLEILEKNINLIKDSDSRENRVVVIIPPQKFGKKKDLLSRLLNVSTLTSVIKMQDDLFKDSGKNQPSSIFVFSGAKPHHKDDNVKYFDFSDSGYIYLKDSGLVDKNNSFEQKKQKLIDQVKNNINPNEEISNAKIFTNFYEVDRGSQINIKIDPKKILSSNDEADISLENVLIKKILLEKQQLIKKNNNHFNDDGFFEKYLIEILSED